MTQNRSIDRVLTISEINDRFGVAKSTLMFAIWRDEIEARQSGKTWLIDAVSFAKWYSMRNKKDGTNG